MWWGRCGRLRVHGGRCEEAGRPRQNPTVGIGDGSPQPVDQKVVARTLALLDRGCTLGDARACAAAMRERGQDADGLAPPACDKTIAWE